MVRKPQKCSKEAAASKGQVWSLEPGDLEAKTGTKKAMNVGIKNL